MFKLASNAYLSNLQRSQVKEKKHAYFTHKVRFAKDVVGLIPLKSPRLSRFDLNTILAKEKSPSTTSYERKFVLWRIYTALMAGKSWSMYAHPLGPSIVPQHFHSYVGLVWPLRSPSEMSSSSNYEKPGGASLIDFKKTKFFSFSPSRYPHLRYP